MEVRIDEENRLPYLAHVFAKFAHQKFCGKGN